MADNRIEIVDNNTYIEIVENNTQLEIVDNNTYIEIIENNTQVEVVDEIINVIEVTTQGPPGIPGDVAVVDIDGGFFTD